LPLNSQWFPIIARRHMALVFTGWQHLQHKMLRLRSRGGQSYSGEISTVIVGSTRNSWGNRGQY
jgi:hypothetical protein